MLAFPYLGARDYFPPALRVTRWYEPMPMRRTLVRQQGETEDAFGTRAQQLAHVWQMTAMDMRHPLLVTVECLFAVPSDPEADDDLWLVRQVALSIMSNVKTADRVRRDAMALLRDLSLCVA